MRPGVAGHVVLIGGSMGSLSAVMDLLAGCPAPFDTAIVLCLHSASRDSADLCAVLSARSRLPVRDAIENTAVGAGVVHVASGDYHLLVEQDGSFALSVDARVHHSRPSIDVLFESAAEAFRHRTLGVLLSGANADGAAGLARIQRLGGTAFVQSPASCPAPQMPCAALARMTPDSADSPQELARQLRVWLSTRNDRGDG